MKFLHLSDIHFEYKIENADSKLLRARLIKTLKEQNIKVDFIIITGDIFFKNRSQIEGFGRNKAKAELLKANTELKEFISHVCTATECDYKNVFICPGNHDVERDNPTRNDIIVKKRENKDFSISKDEIEILHQGFGLFSETYSEITKRDYKDYEIFELPISDDKNKKDNKNTKNWGKVRIISINSSLFSLDNDDYGRLSIYNEFLMKLDTNNKKEENSINILIMHHSITDLNREEFRKMQHWCEDQEIDFVLCGHSHLMGIFTYNQTLREIPEFTCGSLVVDKEITPTFLIYDINTSNNHLRTILYAYFTNVNKWALATSLNRKFDNGVYNFKLPRLIEEQKIQSTTIKSKMIKKQLDELFKEYDEQIICEFGKKPITSSKIKDEMLEFKSNRIFLSLLSVEIPFSDALLVIDSSIKEIIKHKDKLKTKKNGFTTRDISNFVYNSIGYLKGNNYKEVVWAGKYARRNLSIIQIRISTEKFDFTYISQILKEIINSAGGNYDEYSSVFKEDISAMQNEIYHLVKTFETYELGKELLKSLIIEIYGNSPHHWFNKDFKQKENNGIDKITEYNYKKYKEHLEKVGGDKLPDKTEIIQGVALYELLYHSVCTILPFYYPVFGVYEKQPLYILYELLCNSSEPFSTNAKAQIRADFNKYCNEDEFIAFTEIVQGLNHDLKILKNTSEKLRFEVLRKIKNFHEFAEKIYLKKLHDNSIK
jgi:predicted phosphodiesterase